MRHFRHAFKTVLLTAASLLIAISAAASGDRIISFDPPGGINTQPAAINTAGTVVGYYEETKQGFVFPGFVRDSSGKFTSLYVPVAHTTQTEPAWINDAGDITGWYGDGDSVHGFLRDASGHYTSFDPAGAVETQPQSINSSGQISGVYTTSETDKDVGFLRDMTGNFETFGGPGICGDSVLNAMLSATGEIAGTCYYNNGNRTYFIRTTDGTLTEYGNPFGGKEILVSAINDQNVLAGYYTDASGLGHGFWRDASGVHSFDYPGAMYTVSTGINIAGTITGYYSGADGVDHGFVRDQLGNFTSFDDPNAGPQGTVPTAINRSGQITGQFFTGVKGYGHGFLRY
jgi:hypothetical protein